MAKKLQNNYGLTSNLKHHMIWTCKERKFNEKINSEPEHHEKKLASKQKCL